MADEPRTGNKGRSPNYPAMGLPAAIDSARKLWQAEKRTTVPPEVAARAIGYAGISGASRAALAALRQYGLIDYYGGGLALTDTAIDILVHPQGSQDYQRAVTEAANAPEIFREINQALPDASDGALTAYLISRKRFSEDGAQKLVRALRETNLLASRARGGYNEASQAGETAPSGESMNTPIQSQQQTVGTQAVAAMQFLLGGGRRAEIRFIGGEPEPSHIQKLEAYLKTTREALENP